MFNVRTALFLGVLCGTGACGVSDTIGPGSMAEPGPSASGAGPVLAVEALQVTTLTTVQSSTGRFLSPVAERLVPEYLEPGAARALTAGLAERAHVDLALLFRGQPPVAATWPLDVNLRMPAGGDTAFSDYFPNLAATDWGARWPLQLRPSDPATVAASAFAEWSGWHAFPGLSVQPQDADAQNDSFRAPAASLEFEQAGSISPLILSSDAGNLIVTNRSAETLSQALLIYSHSGGISITVVENLEPSASRVTPLGPKEGPVTEQVERAREVLAQFFAQRTEAELADALALAKSAPFLEEPGLRLVTLAPPGSALVHVEFTPDVSAQSQLGLIHSEIFDVGEEMRVVDLLMNTQLEVNDIVSQFGRYAEAKLEFAAQSADTAVATRAHALLEDLNALNVASAR